MTYYELDEYDIIMMKKENGGQGDELLGVCFVASAIITDLCFVIGEVLLD